MLIPASAYALRSSAVLNDCAPAGSAGLLISHLLFDPAVGHQPDEGHYRVEHL